MYLLLRMFFLQNLSAELITGITDLVKRMVDKQEDHLTDSVEQASNNIDPCAAELFATIFQLKNTFIYENKHYYLKLSYSMNWAFITNNFIIFHAFSFL